MWPLMFGAPNTLQADRFQQYRRPPLGHAPVSSWFGGWPRSNARLTSGIQAVVRSVHNLIDRERRRGCHRREGTLRPLLYPRQMPGGLYYGTRPARSHTNVAENVWPSGSSDTAVRVKQLPSNRLCRSWVCPSQFGNRDTTT